MADILITEGHNGAAVSAKVGDMLTIQLPENPTTGYRWTVMADFGSLTLKEDEFEPAGQSNIGGGGLRRWRFAAERAGGSQVEFQLTRTWESGAPKAAFRVHVQ